MGGSDQATDRYPVPLHRILFGYIWPTWQSELRHHIDIPLPLFGTFFGYPWSTWKVELKHQIDIPYLSSSHGSNAQALHRYPFPYVESSSNNSDQHVKKSSSTRYISHFPLFGTFFRYPWSTWKAELRHQIDILFSFFQPFSDTPGLHEKQCSGSR